ncbi:MAG: AmmeMemoRadiSam system protein B [Sedimentisphaerales bacterium]|nr:AmmeMemoRadiSam system protein B [Sedimentisphaerales bacterium]
MAIRKPVVAGQFYPGSATQCRQEAQHYLEARAIEVDLPQRIVAGIVPHAGWMFSADLAGMVFAAIRQANKGVDTFVLFGAAHRYYGTGPAVYDTGVWETPLGQVAVDEELAERIVNETIAVAAPEAHRGEHSIEVQLPLLQTLWPQARIVPIIVPGTCDAAQLGEQIGRVMAEEKEKSIVCIASTDLTHYGPRYGFAPAGTGAKGIAWAKEVNDMEFIKSALVMEAQAAQATGLKEYSACGPGAVAAAVGAAKRLGKTEGILLAHTTSSEVMQDRFGESSSESVGYAAIVY